MDLIFQRYSSPFLLIDSMIEQCQFSQFVNNLVEKVNRENIYDVWLHRVFDKSFNDYYQEILDRMNQKEVDVTSAIKESIEVLNIIQPQGGE